MDETIYLYQMELSYLKNVFNYSISKNNPEMTCIN